jgi:hypothetical protein
VILHGKFIYFLLIHIQSLQLHQMLSKSHAIHLRVVRIVRVDQSETPPYVLVSQAIWEYHQNVDRNAFLAPNALLLKLV